MCVGWGRVNACGAWKKCVQYVPTCVCAGEGNAVVGEITNVGVPNATKGKKGVRGKEINVNGESCNVEPKCENVEEPQMCKPGKSTQRQNRGKKRVGMWDEWWECV